MSIDSIEGDWVVCEVENIPVIDSKAEDFSNKPCFMTTVHENLFVFKGFPIEEGMVFTVLHNGETIDSICSIDEQERKRRIEILKQFQ